MASEPWGDDAGPFGLLVRQLAERLKSGGPGLPARIVSLAHRVGICHLLARDELSNARRFVHPTDMAAYDEATVQLETTLVLYLGGAYAAATGDRPALELPTLFESLASAEGEAFSLLGILGRAQATPVEGARGLLGDMSNVGPALGLTLGIAMAIVVARRSAERDLEAVNPRSTPTYAAARQREYRHRRANKAKRVRLDIYPEDEWLLSIMGFLASPKAESDAELSDAVEAFFIASMLSNPGAPPFPTALTAQGKRLEALGIRPAADEEERRPITRRKRTSRIKPST